VRHVLQLHFNQLFSNNKVSIKNYLVFFYLYGFSSTNHLPLLSLSWVFFISSMHMPQMANTRNLNNNNRDNNGENNQNLNPPPPPPPTLEQVLAMQAQMH
jgi:flagellum-specific peptidoglycan hydrolase FlgJ